MEREYENCHIKSLLKKLKSTKIEFIINYNCNIINLIRYLCYSSFRGKLRMRSACKIIS